MLSRKECIEYLEKINMPCHIRRHSMMVAKVALFLGERLNRNGSRLDLRLVETGALLHDVGKERTLKTGEDHALVGAEMLAGIVTPATARIVREHIFLEPHHVEGQLSEAILVNYSDKRVMHEQVVSVQTRYHDLIERYAKTPVHHRRLLEKLELYLALERKIFSHLSIEPRGAEIMGLKLNNNKGAGSEYDRQEAHCGVAGGRQIG